MREFYDWIALHWLAASLVFFSALALAFIFVKRKSLFYKE